MWRPGNIERRGGTTARPWGTAWGLGLAMWVCLAHVAPIHAQPVAIPAQAPLVDASHALAAFRLAQGWARAGRLPVPSADRAIWASGVDGVKVTLRWSGMPMGDGEATLPVQAVPPPVGTDDAQATSRVRNLADLTRQATQAALADADARIKQQMSSTQTPVPVEQRLTLEKLGPALAIDVQVALEARSVRVPKGQSPALAFAPGHHGLLLIQDAGGGSLRSARIWPANALSSNLTPAAQLRILLRQLALPDSVLDQLGAAQNPELAIARFEVIHLAESPEHTPLAPLVRGNLQIPPEPLTLPSLGAMADRLADHLKRRQSGKGELAGTYQPTSDRWDQPTASLPEQALGAYVMARHAAALNAAEPDSLACAEAREHVRKAVASLTRKMLQGEAPERDPAALALLVLTLSASPQVNELQQEFDSAALLLEALIDKEGGFRPVGVAPQQDAGDGAATPPAGKPEAMALAHRAVVLCALSAVYERTREPGVSQTLLAARNRLWKGLDAADLAQSLQALPWLLVTETRMRRLGGDAEAATWAARGPIFKDLLGQLRKLQVREVPAVGPADVVGGYVRSEQPTGTPPNPDWLTANVVLSFAIALREPGLVTPAERPSWTLDAALGSRFLAQLLFDGPGCWYVRSTRDVLGGVRLSPWNNTLGVAPTAVTLLAVTELGETLLTQ